jgi:phage I-like protein
MPIPDGEPPSEFRIWTWGDNPTLKGTVRLDEESAAAVIAAYNEHGVDLAIDYEHQTFNSEDNGKPAPAAGWFKPEVRADGLWATSVRWTDEARSYLKQRSYRYFSPTAELEAKTRRPVRLMPMALTNWPATKNLEPLVARADETTTETTMKTVLVALGLKADADEAAAERAATKLREFKGKVLALTGKDSGSDALGVLTALKLKAEKADALETELQKLKDETIAAEKKTLIDDAILNLGVAPAKRADLEALELKALKVTLSLLPKVKQPAEPPKVEPKNADVSGLSEAERVILKNTGLTPEKYLEHRKQYRAAMSERGLRTLSEES